MMPELLKRLFDIVMFRRGPQDLPAGRSVLLTCMGMYIVVATAGLMQGRTEANPVLILALASLLPLLLCWIVLKLRRREARWEQTLSALFGTSALLSLLTLPIRGGTAPELEPNMLIALFGLAVFGWSFAVNGHIWRHALDVGFAAGLAVAVVLFALTLNLINLMAGPL